MAEQISFYDKLKSDMVGDAYSAAAKSPKVRAAAQFATDYELGADRPTLVKSLQQGVQEVADSDTPGGTRTLSAQSTADGLIKRLNEIEQRLASPDARMDSSYRARLIDARNSLANDVRKLDLPAGQSLADSGIRHYSRLAEADRALEERDPYGPSRRRTATAPGGDSPYAQARRAQRDAVEAFDAIDTRNPSSETDRALNDAMNRIKATNTAVGEAHQRAMDDRLTRARTPQTPPASQLDLYRDAKNLIERNADDVIRAGKRALSNPAVKRGLGVAAGLMGSKIATAATSGGADLVQELAFGAPAAFIQGYNRSRDPYEQVKYVAEELGPIDKLQSKSLDTLSYDDVVRLRQEGHLTPKAQQQYRQHVIRTEGFDPDEVYRLQ